MLFVTWFALDNQRDQHYIGPKYNGGLQRVTIELMVPSIILEEEKQMLRRIQF